MKLFGTASPFDADVDKATSENNTTESWGVIMDICDRVGSSSKNSKDCLRSIIRRLGHEDPHVSIQAITLLDACINNCGKSFHLEIASREFETEYRRLLAKSEATVAMKLKVSLKKWAENEFKNDSQLNLIPSLYHKLKEEGFDFTDTTASQTPKAHQAAISKDPNVVSSQQEQDDIAKAIELSLKEKGGQSEKSSSLYPSMSLNGAGGASGGSSFSPATQYSRPSDARKVRALYDFEAAEDNELTFSAGDIIHVLDDGDPNWWKGFNNREEGLFPSNFVTADLSVEPESFRLDLKNKKSVQFEDEQKKDVDDEIVEISEEKIDRLLHLLHEANPEDPSQDTHEMINLEGQVNSMLPLIDTELERVDRKHAQLTQLSSDLVEAINLYHTLMRAPDRSSVGPYSMQYPNQHPMYGGVPVAGNLPPYGGGLFDPAAAAHMYSLPSNMMPPPTSLPSVPQHLQQQQQHNMMMMPQQQRFAPMQQPHPQQHPHQFPPPQQQQIPRNDAIGPPQSMPMQQQQQQQPPHIQQQQGPPTTSQQQPPTTNIPQQHNNFHPHNMVPSQNMHLPPMNAMSMQSGMPPISQDHGFQQSMMHPQSQNMIPSMHQQQQLHGQPHHQFNNQHGSPIHLNNMQQQQLPPNIAAITQPVTNTILPSQNDSRNSIPIYQQQR